MSKQEIITITKKEYENLLFREQQIKQINKLVDELEGGNIDGFDFGEKVLDIL